MTAVKGNRVEVTVYEVGDYHGDSVAIPCGDVSEFVKVFGVDADGTRRTYDGPLYDLLPWCEQFGFTWTKHRVVLDVTDRRVAEWGKESYT